jgi:hypothetical protein
VSLSLTAAGCPIVGLRCRLAGLGFQPGAHAPSAVVSKRTPTGWIAPGRARPMRQIRTPGSWALAVGYRGR